MTMKLICLYMLITLITTTAAAVSWERHSKPVEAMHSDEMPKSRAYLPPRYANLFGTKSAVVRDGSAFLPRTISDFTGKLGQIRRQTFSWQPSRVNVDSEDF
ncbi:unnamed protein product [Auanema sp. JU1783]|nr:unnamed protein product [Auanema sp. JU1783]